MRIFHPAEWPHWLQVLIAGTHGVAGWIMTWLWWPKNDKGWRRFGVLALYLLLAYYFVIRKFQL
jgi:hypothetical protein